MNGAKTIFKNLEDNISKVIIGKNKQIKEMLCCWVAGGHLLLEDVPGTGKTMLARSIAASLKLDFNRIQFTPDLLPSDLTGHSIYNQENNCFEFHPGPIFTTILIGDEINRATPRTQSALLEAMGEGQVTIEGETRPLSELFFVIATQNPVDQLGTFTLPEAQMDRFMMKLSLGYPGKDQEKKIIRSLNEVHPIKNLGQVESIERLTWLRKQVSQINVTDEILNYIITLIDKTRTHKNLKLGASPRGTIALTKCAQTLALYEGKNYVSPDNVFALIKPVISHRLILTPEAKVTGVSIESVIDEIIKSTPVPVEKQ